MSDPSDVPAVVVERAPDGWTHIGGPGMHLLIGLDEDDDRTIAASDAADGGDLDDVLEVLTAGGMRKAHHFVGVHWQPRTRVVAFGPVSAHVTLHDGTDHDVRATSSRVWTDLELPEHPERVVLRVLEESERSQPQPAQDLARGLSATSDGATGADGADEAATTDEPATTDKAATTDQAVADTPAAEAVPGDPPVAPGPSLAAPQRPVEAPATPTVGGLPKSSPWDRSWATPRPAEATPPAPGALRSWESVRPAAPTPAATPAPPVPAPPVPAPAPPTPAAEQPRPEQPAASDLPAPAPRDLDSTWSARPVLEPEPASVPAPPTCDPRPLADGSASHAGPGGTAAEEAEPAAPSYDYLFGHTTAADEHRRVLAELTRSDDEDTVDDTADDTADGEVLSVPAVADTTDVPVTNLAPTPEVPTPPIPVVPDLPPVPEGGLISSVPWAVSAPAPEVPKPEPAAPTFSGRHTPPPPPSLLPPMNTPPPGARAPEATPLISTGPPPVPPASAGTGAPTAPAAAPHPSASRPTLTSGAPAAQAAQAAGTAYPAVPQPPAEPTFDVPIAPRQAEAAPAVPGPSPVPVPVPQAEVTDDDDAELTVDRSALLEARNAAQNQAISGPSVLAVLCSAGHPTPPHSDRCRVCGAGIPPQGPFTMPRPPLGVLRLSTGDVVTLDRSVLLGRAPKLGEGLAAHDRPHVVKVPSPERDISRNHVEVVLEGWHVLIRDLATTNGTTVTLPGESPVRLRANDQQVLEPGSLVSMADEVFFTFEAAV